MVLYVLIDSSLDTVYGMVQGSHAVAQACIDFPSIVKNSWNNGRLVMLSCDDLCFVREQLDFRWMNATQFFEPDLGGKMTAIAVFEEAGSVDAKLLSHYKLWGT